MYIFVHFGIYYTTIVLTKVFYNIFRGDLR